MKVIDLDNFCTAGDPLPSAEQVKFPCVVKASKGEDTKAVRLVKDYNFLNAAIEHALSFSDHVIIERLVYPYLDCLQNTLKFRKR